MASSIMIRFVSGKGLDSKLIEWYSRCRWSHVEFVSDGCTFGAQLRGGLKWRTLDDPCYRHASAFETWTIPVTDDQYIDFIRMIDAAIDARYDWKAIVSFVLGPWRWHTKGAWICSSFVAGMLQSLQLLPRVMWAEMYDPRDIYLVVQQIPSVSKVG
jgi:hypothetical protein